MQFVRIFLIALKMCRTLLHTARDQQTAPYGRAFEIIIFLSFLTMASLVIRVPYLLVVILIILDDQGQCASSFA